MIKNRMAMRGQGGFTLIELLVVVAILAILVGAAVVGIGAMRENAQETACKSDRDTVQTAAEAYAIDNLDTTGFSRGAVTIGSLTGGGADAYLKKIDSADMTVVWSTGSGEFVATAEAGGKYADVASDCNA